ncbi:ATP-binding protein [Pseudomonas fluorescens]|uniref:ATP-binding protein n=1 Tax=Pseudomonas fluorescens TaxID=294 RepID=UPI000693BCDE|nr:winged helix-turn-helix domain-containing protein [Pseudomonas fluorescens]
MDSLNFNFEDAQRLVPIEICFGDFQFFPAKRLLLKEGGRVEIGGRALDILLVLIVNAGKVVSNRELIRIVWQDVVVEGSSLRVHICGLRKALSCSDSDANFVVNAPGRGYSFVAPVILPNPARPKAQLLRMQAWSAEGLPPRLTRMVGRDDTVTFLANNLKQRRFITITGPGGMGKTTVAVAVAHTLLSHFEGAVYFLDLGSVTDPALLVGTLATAFGVLCKGSDSTRELVVFLKNKRLLLVLDSCEHLIDAVAALTERLFWEARQFYILASSREPLQAEGENVHRLCPLACPPEQSDLSAANALEFPAVQLFVDRASAGGTPLVLSDDDAPVVAHICRKLDGIALAIELGARRVEAYGIQGTADLLNSRFSLFWNGRRTALPRHQTLNAMLDWSYSLLSSMEAMVLRRLSVLSGGFSLDTATEVVSDSGADEAQVIDMIGRLVLKSLISAQSFERTMRYRLLDTTRVYALEKLRQSDEAEDIAKRHALYQIALLERLDVTSVTFLEYEHAHRYLEHLGNIRAALEWSFSDTGDLTIGIRLTAATVPLFLGLSMLNECLRWSEQALSARDEAGGSAQEIILLEAFAISSMFTHGNTPAVHTALIRGIDLAIRLDDAPRQLRLLAGLNIFFTRVGNFQSALLVAHQNMEVSTRVSGPAGIAMAQWMLGVSCHLVGQQAQAQQLCTAGLNMVSSQPHGDAIYFGYDHQIRALVSLARTLWLRGYPDQAVVIAQQALADAQNLKHPVTICISLIYVSTVFLWVGDWATAESTIDKLILNASKNALNPDQAVGMGLKGILMIRQGHVDCGVVLLQQCLTLLTEENHQVLSTMFMKSLAEGMALRGEFDNARQIIVSAQCMVEDNGETFDTPELLRIAAEIYSTQSTPDFDRAETCIQRSLDCAYRQTALGWELRTSITLARLRVLQGRNNEAYELIWQVYRRFSEGFDSVDLRTARQLLHKLPHARNLPGAPLDSQN